MSTSPKKLPRFLPTLTEVVDPSSLNMTSAPAAAPDFEDLVRSVLERVDAALERRLLEETELLVRLQLAQQLPSLRASLHQEVDSLVRQSVAETMASLPSQHN